MFIKLFFQVLEMTFLTWVPGCLRLSQATRLLDLVLLRPKLLQLPANGREVAVQSLRQRQIT